MNTYSSSNIPVITDATGQVNANHAFTMDQNTLVYKSCSVTFKNQHYVFGGSHHGIDGDYSRQISQIDGCQLRRIGDLPFDHSYGTCTAVGDDRIYLCFNDGSWAGDDYEKCRYATRPEGPFSEVALSNHHHRFARIAASSSKMLNRLFILINIS